MVRKESRPLNSTLAIGGISCTADSYMVAETFVLRINICAKSPPIANLQNVSGNSMTTQQSSKRRQ